MQFSVYSLLLIISFLVSGVACYFSLARKTTTERKFLFPLLLSIAIWSFANLMSSFTVSMKAHLFFAPCTYLGVTNAPVFYLLFALQYSHNLPKLSALHYILLFFIPGITLIAAFTNQFHHLLWSHAEWIYTSLAGYTVQHQMGILGWTFVGYSYLLILLSLISLIRSFLYSPDRYASQLRVIIFAVVIPMLGNFLYLLNPEGIEHVDLTPVGFSIAGFLLLVGMKRHGLLRIKPLGRDFLFESMNEGVLFLDVRNQIVDYNKTASRILKIRFGPDMMKNSQEIIKRHPKLYEFCLSPANECNGFQLYELPPTYFHIQKHELKDHWNNVIGKVVQFHDITEAKRSYDIIDQQNKELSRLNRQKDKMISIISHDLRSPFISIISLVELMKLKNDILSEKDRMEFFTKLLNRAKTTYDLLENLLQWSKSDSDQIQSDIRPVDLDAEISDLYTMYEGLAYDKHITIRIGEYTGSPSPVRANGQLLHTVLRNLLTNAIKFTPDGGGILIQCKYLAEHCEVSVADNGVGMTFEARQKLFQSDSGYYTKGTRGESGSGLGLMLCKEFVERMGGTLTIHSQPGKGTRVSFTLPYALKYEPAVKQS